MPGPFLRRCSTINRTLPDPKIRNRAQVPALAQLSLYASEVGTTCGRDVFCCLLHLFRLVRGRAPAVLFGPILAYVSIWVSLRLFLLRHSMVTEIQLEQQPG